MRSETSKRRKCRLVLVATLLLVAGRTLGADIVWTNAAGGAWLEAGNWDPAGPPAATNGFSDSHTAYITNAVDSYTVQYNTAEAGFRGTNAVLVMGNTLPGQTVTLEVNANMGASSSANYHRMYLLGNTRIVANAHIRFAAAPASGSAGVQYSDWEINDGGQITFTGTGSLIGSLHIKSGGRFTSANPFRTSGDTSILIEEGGRWDWTGSGGLVQLGEKTVVGTTVVTNWGRVHNASTDGNNFNIGSRGNNVNAKTYWWQMEGSRLENLRSTLHIAVGYAEHDPSPGESIFYLVGGSVTNRGQLVIGINENTSGSTRTANGLVNIWGGNWENEGLRVVIGGFKPTYASTPNDAGHRTNHSGALVQTNGTFRSLGDVLVANGPSQGRLEISGGTFTVTNAAQNAALVIGAAQFNTISPAPGDGILRLEGGTLRVNHLLATNGVARSKIEFDGGTLETAGTEVDNGGALAVGDGTSAATLALMGGTHAFEDGLTLNANATLRIGATNAIASATIDGNLVLETGSRLAWTFEGGDQDLATVTGTVTLPDSVTVEVFALDGSTPASIPLITAANFSGTPSDWPSVTIQGAEYQPVLDGNTLALQIPRGTLILLR